MDMSYRALRCEDAREIVASRELGFELEAGQKESVEAHLAGCEACRRALLEEEELSSLLSEHARRLSSESAELADRIAQALPAQPGVCRSRLHLRAVAAAAVLFCAGLLVGTFLQGKLAPQEEPEGPPRVSQQRTTRPLLVGQTGLISHELLGEKRPRTTGISKLVVVDPKNPDVKIEVDVQLIIEDVNSGLEYR